MNGVVSAGVSTGVVTQPTDVQESVSPQTTETTSQVEQTLGGAPRTPVTASTSAQQTVSTRPLSSLGGTGTRGVSSNPQTTQKAQSKARAGLAKQIGITVPPASRAVSLDSRMIAKEIQSLPKSQRQAAMAQAGKTLQQRVNNGFKVHQQIQAGTANTPASSTDIRDFMTFLTAKASQKTAAFANGAFNLPDPGNKIRDFLDSSTEVYQRSSTHIEGFSDHGGCGHRGIDLKLPHGMGTLMYGGMEDGVMGTQGDRIFLKMESHGCRISTLSENQVDTQGPQSRPKRFMSDILSAVKHGWGAIKTLLGLQNTKGTRKERLDKGVEKSFKALVEKARTSGTPGLADALDLNNPAGKRTGHGVRTMMKNINVLLDLENQPEKAKAILGLETLPQDLRTELEAFKGELESRYDHVEHRIGNEVVFDTEELTGAGNAKDKMREGQARSLVSQLTTIKDAESVTTDDLKGLVTTMYALGSTIDGEGKDDRAAQKDAAITKAITGLSTGQKAHLNEILTSPKVQDLANEFLDRSMGAEFELPGHSLGHQQELNVRGLMADAMETLTFMTQEVGGQPRLDGEYAQSQVEDLTDTIFDITDAMTEPKSQEQIQEYLSGVKIENRSALQLQTAAGKGNMVVGTSAKALFPSGPPRVNSKDLNAKTKEQVKDLLNNPPATATEGLANRLGISDNFMNDFARSGVVVNGTRIGSLPSNPPQEHLDQALQTFVDALGGPEQAVTASKLLFQAGEAVVMTTHFENTGETGQALGQAMLQVQQQTAHLIGTSLPTGSERSITVDDDGSATLSLRHNMGAMDQVTYNAELGIKLSSLSGDVQVEMVQTAMVFTSND
ncbi:MAG: hypothetical protein JEZ12_11505 [Desulfobacterium sp.]|nr:hypothetical protein [Desulfobacterium sp.]